jgi:hypothetical protein
MEGRRQKAEGGRASTRPCFFCLLPLGICFLLAGCQSCEHVEAELRTRENEVRELREQLYHSEAFNHALQQQQLHAPPPGPALNSASKLPADAVLPGCIIKEIVLGRLTGGYDDDRCPGDEGLQVIVEPRDPDGHSIKVPGTLYVTVLEVSPEGVKTPLSSWAIPPEELRRAWRTGLLSTGYYLTLPWKVWPTREKLRVVVQFILPDGRLFEADKDVTIRLVPDSYRKAVPVQPPAESGPRLEPADDAVPLPAPRRLMPPADADPQARSTFRSAKPATLQPTGLWRQGAPAPLAESVRLSRPVPLDEPVAPGR